MLTGLSQYLDCHIFRNQILLDQRTKKDKLCIRSSRETNLDLLKSYFAEQFKESHFLIKAHGANQRLVSVTQVNAAPLWRFFYIFLFGPVHADFRRHKILSCILSVIHHTVVPPVF